jgi:hypothetical protein
MLVVFSESSPEELAQRLGIATWYNEFRNEDFNYCVRREIAQEILACRALQIPYVVIREPSFFKADNEEVIIDSNCELDALDPNTTLVLRINGKAVLPEKLRLFPQLNSEGQNLQVDQWPDHISHPDRFLKRAVVRMNEEFFAKSFLSGDLESPFMPFFLKTVAKSQLHHVITSPLELNGLIKSVQTVRDNFPSLAKDVRDVPGDTVVALHQFADWYCPYREAQIKGEIRVINLSEGVILSTIMQIVRESTHKGEYRAFIINGEVSSLSAYLDYDHAEVPEAISDFAQAFAEEHRHLAPSYVADFCLTDQGPVLIELNSFTYSGRYIDNDPGLLYSDLERLLGVDRSVLCEPRIAVPEKAQTDHPDPDQVAVNFGEPALALLANQAEQMCDEYGDPMETSLTQRFAKALQEHEKGLPKVGSLSHSTPPLSDLG